MRMFDVFSLQFIMSAKNSFALSMKVVQRTEWNVQVSIIVYCCLNYVFVINPYSSRLNDKA